MSAPFFVLGPVLGDSSRMLPEIPTLAQTDKEALISPGGACAPPGSLSFYFFLIASNPCQQPAARHTRHQQIFWVIRDCTCCVSGCGPLGEQGLWLTPTIQRWTVQLSVDADTARCARGETAGNFLGFLDCQITRVLAAQYSIVLLHNCFPFSSVISSAVVHPVPSGLAFGRSTSFNTANNLGCSN